MLFCLNPPHSLPFPHWPDGATLPAAAAADVSLARARSSRTRLPAPGSLQLRADSPAPPRWLQTRGHARARGAEGLGGGDARGRRQPPFSRPSLPRAEVGGTRGPGRAEPCSGRFPFLPQSPGAPRGPALKRAGNLVYRSGRGTDRAFVWKVSISGSGCNVFLVTLASGRRRRRGVARFMSGFRGESGG